MSISDLQAKIEQELSEQPTNPTASLCITERGIGVSNVLQDFVRDTTKNDGILSGKIIHYLEVDDDETLNAANMHLKFENSVFKKANPFEGLDDQNVRSVLVINLMGKNDHTVQRTLSFLEDRSEFGVDLSKVSVVVLQSKEGAEKYPQLKELCSVFSYTLADAVQARRNSQDNASNHDLGYEISSELKREQDDRQNSWRFG